MMGPKHAMVVLAMAREGQSVSAQDIDEAQKACGLTVASIHQGPESKYAAKTYGDDEDLSDQRGIDAISA